MINKKKRRISFSNIRIKGVLSGLVLSTGPALGQVAPEPGRTLSLFF